MPKHSIKVDLPTPGGPDNPIRYAGYRRVPEIVCGGATGGALSASSNSSRDCCMWSGRVDSTAVGAVHVMWRDTERDGFRESQAVTLPQSLPQILCFGR